MLRRTLIFIAPLACFAASTMPPEADQRLAHDIYKEIIEIKSGFTTGATTPVVEAIARRLRAAGFPDSDIFIGGAIPAKANLVVRYHGAAQTAAKPLRIGPQELAAKNWPPTRCFTATVSKALLTCSPVHLVRENAGLKANLRRVCPHPWPHLQHGFLGPKLAAMLTAD